MFKTQLTKNSVTYYHRITKDFSNSKQSFMFIAGKNIAIRVIADVYIGAINYNYEVNSRAMEDGKATFYTGTKKELQRINEDEFMLDQGSVLGGLAGGVTNSQFWTSQAESKRVLWKIHNVVADLSGDAVGAASSLGFSVYIPKSDEILFQVINSGWPEDEVLENSSLLEQTKQKASDTINTVIEAPEKTVRMVEEWVRWKYYPKP